MQVFTTVTVRKLATVISFVVAAAFLLLVGYVPRNNHAGHVSAVVFVTVAVSGLGVGVGGWDVNALGGCGTGSWLLSV